MEFTYNASACAAGGVIQKRNGDYVVIPSLASVALAPTGGEGVTIERNYESEAVSFSYAETRVFGREVSPSVFTTQTDVYITNLRVFDVLSIAMLRATVTSTRKVDSDSSRLPDPHDNDHAFDLEASYHGVEVRNPVTFGRCEVAPKLDVAMKSIKRYKHLSDLVNGPAGVEVITDDGTRLPPCSDMDKRMLFARFNAGETGAELTNALNAKHPVLGSLVEDVEGDSTGDESIVRTHRKLHKVYIPKFGTVRFGELMLKPGRRRVNLLRIQLIEDELLSLTAGPPPNESVASDLYQGGSLTMGSVEGNGSPLYP